MKKRKPITQKNSPPKKIEKGLSQVIAVLLFILLSIGLVGILWVVINNFVRGQADIAEAETAFFNEPLTLLSVKFPDQNTVRISIKKVSGNLVTNTTGTDSEPVPVDVVSVADVSGSMRDCKSINSTCSCNSYYGTSLHGLSQPPHCYAVPSSYIGLCSPVCGGTLLDGLNSSKNANKLMINTLISGEVDNRLGISTYNNMIMDSYSSDLTQDVESLNGIIDSWESTGSTCICCGINDARGKLLGSADDILKTMIVMSDGEANVACPEQDTGDSKQDAIQAACDAYSEINNLTIYTVGLGGGVDTDTMESIANCGNGTYFSVSEIDDLVDIYQTLAERIVQTSKPIKKLKYLKVIFYDNESNSFFENVDIPDPLATRNYQFDFSGEGLTGPIVKVEVFPALVTKSGEEIIGPQSAVWTK